MPRSPNDALLREILPIPDIGAGPYAITLYPGRLDETCFINVMNRSHVIIANLVVPKGDGSIDGVVINQGTITGGWALYVKHGKPTYVYNCVGVESYKVTGANPLSAGEHQVRVEFACRGHGPGGTATLFVDGARAGSMRVSRARLQHFWLNDSARSLDATFANASMDFALGTSAFGGEIKWIRIEVARAPSAVRPIF